ncbi:MAG TPA: HD family phosphohydrolase [Bacillales bacterium]|nr:HD family phosphohydrolase [Bacillales bacterium]
MKAHIPKWRNLEDNRPVRIAIYAALGVMMYLAMLSNVMPEKLNVELFSVAKKDILSPITTKDVEATKQKQEEAAAAVPSKFTFKQQASLIQIEKANAIFESATKVVQQSMAQAKENKQQANATNETSEPSQSPEIEKKESVKPLGTVDERVNALKGRLSGDAIDKVSHETLVTLVNADPAELAMAREVTNTTINSVMSDHIKWSELQAAKGLVKEKVPSSSLSGEMERAVIQISKGLIVPNYVFNAEKTKQARQEAIESVEPVMIQEGQILAKKNQDVINHQIYHQLQVVGLLDDDFNPYPYIGLALFVLLITGLLIYELNNVESKVRSRNTYLLMFMMVLFVTLLFMKTISLLEPLGLHGLSFLVPAAAGTMLVRMLVNERLAITSCLVLALCGSLIFNTETLGTINFMFGIYILFSCLAGAVVLEKHNARPKILKTGLFISFVNMVVVGIFLMLRNGNYETFDILLQFGFAFLSGFVAAVLTLGLMPFFEAAFGILSTMRLIELSSPNHPLLRKILTEAPGTYHHSVMVANLAEGACEAIGANGLLARVAAYYHDIGKTKRPRFFIENQMGMENPHDKISPQLSRTVIISHPYDGVSMLKAHHLPKEIIDIAEQHHGTTLLKFFYHKALAKDSKGVSEQEFRYPGPKVQTREAAVIEVADSVEAATRSLSKPTPEKIESLVRKIITERLEDGQFNECHITLKELDTVAKSICETLKGIFHSRIEYPEMDLKKKVGHG